MRTALRWLALPFLAVVAVVFLIAHEIEWRAVRRERGPQGPRLDRMRERGL